MASTDRGSGSIDDAVTKLAEILESKFEGGEGDAETARVISQMHDQINAMADAPDTGDAKGRSSGRGGRGRSPTPSYSGSESRTRSRSGSGSYTGSDSRSYSSRSRSRSHSDDSYYSGSDGSGSYTGSESYYSGSETEGTRTVDGSQYTGSVTSRSTYTATTASYTDRSSARGSKKGSRAGGAKRRPRTAPAAPPVVEMPKHPRPVDLWRAAHEVDAVAKPPKKLSKDEWDDLVVRLSSSSREKQTLLMRAEHARMAEELRGQRFTPHICRKSRELAEMNKGLPERLGSLMRRRAKKIDQIRHEQAQKQLEEVTFQPKINSKSQRLTRKVANLTKYAEVKKIRAQQRRQIMQEVEDRELTFAPQISAHSLKLVAKRKEARERKRRESEVAAAVSGATAETAAAAAKRRSAKGRPTRLDPGHEQETFKPRINPRSRGVPRQGSVFERLAKGDKMGRIEQRSSSSVMTGSSVRDPNFFNVVEYKAKYDFIVRDLQAATGGAGGR